eukprot:4341445-Prymnesium_polylepis.1
MRTRVRSRPVILPSANLPRRSLRQNDSSAPPYRRTAAPSHAVAPPGARRLGLSPVAQMARFSRAAATIMRLKSVYSTKPRSSPRGPRGSGVAEGRWVEGSKEARATSASS